MSATPWGGCAPGLPVRRRGTAARAAARTIIVSRVRHCQPASRPASRPAGQPALQLGRGRDQLTASAIAQKSKLALRARAAGIMAARVAGWWVERTILQGYGARGERQEGKQPCRCYTHARGGGHAAHGRRTLGGTQLGASTGSCSAAARASVLLMRMRTLVRCTGMRNPKSCNVQFASDVLAGEFSRKKVMKKVRIPVAPRIQF